MGRDSIGDRMKGYEIASRTALPMRMPVVVRLDGKAFHTWTRGLERPFCASFIEVMNGAAQVLCGEMQGAIVAYVQSDEISVLLHNYKRLTSAAWFDNEVQKIVSVGASIAAAAVTAASGRIFSATRLAFFDARVFVLPEADVCNYFLWRQQDATRNSVQMVAQSMFSPRELHGQNCPRLQEMIFQKSGQSWNDLATHLKRGRCVVREVRTEDGAVCSGWVVDNEVPIFSANRAYIEDRLAVEPEDAEPLPRFGAEMSS